MSVQLRWLLASHSGSGSGSLPHPAIASESRTASLSSIVLDASMEWCAVDPGCHSNFSLRFIEPLSRVNTPSKDRFCKACFREQVRSYGRAMRADSEKPAPTSQQVEAVHADVQGRLGSSLRRLRGDLGWGQEEAAWQAQVGIRVYQRLEAGRAVNPTLATLAKLAVAFRVDVRELLIPADAPTPRRPGRPRRAKKPDGTPVAETHRSAKSR